MTDVFGHVVEVFYVLIGDDNHVARIRTPPSAGNEHRYRVRPEDDTALCITLLCRLSSINLTKGTDIAGRRVIIHLAEPFLLGLEGFELLLGFLELVAGLLDHCFWGILDIGIVAEAAF